MATYDIGDTPRLTGTFTVHNDSTGAEDLTDPTTVSLIVRKPDGNATTYTWGAATVTKSSTGVFYRDVAIDQSGNWYYQWVGTGTVPTSEPGSFYVRVRRA